MTLFLAFILAAGDPYTAYEQGEFDHALQKFLDQQVERPGDPESQMRVGSAHYKMNNWAEAEKAFHGAALAGDDKLRARALYNLGNVAYRRGKLDEAIAGYQATLALDPHDEDAKFNLEFVRNELRRRMEEAQKRKPEQPQPQPGEQQQEQSQEDQSQKQGDQEQEPQPQEPAAGQDAEKEREAAKTPAGEVSERGLSKAEAEQALRAIEQKRPEKRQRVKSRRPQPHKDW